MLAKAAGIATRNECPDSWRAFEPICLASKLWTEETRFFADSGFPSGNEKTALLDAMFDGLIDANFNKADNGQKLQSPILKMSTKSPCGFLIAFGNLMLMMAEPESEKWTRSQVRFSCELFFSSGRISPNRKEPKKATQQAAHNRFAFLCPPAIRNFVAQDF